MNKFVEVNGFRISYYDKNPSAKSTLIFIHGNSGSFATWSNQFNSPLFQNYRLIGFDLPGHGLSDASPNPDIDYSPIMIGKLMAEATSALTANEPYILIGFSFGTNVIGEMLSNNLAAKGIILVSACILSNVSDLQKIFLPNPNANSFFMDVVAGEDLESLAGDCFFSDKRSEVERFKSDFNNTKAPFRSTLMKKASEGAVGDEINLVRNTDLPVLTVFGSEDRIVNASYLDDTPIRNWRGIIYKLPGAGHFVHVDQYEKFNQLASDYANEIFTTNHV